MTTHPFLGTEALATGRLSRRAVRRQQPVYRNVYLAPHDTLTPLTRAEAAWLRSGRSAIVGGLSAAALYETTSIDPCAPAELFRTNGKPVEGILIHRDVLRADEYRSVRGIPTTTPARTAFDLGRLKGLTHAVERVDALARQTGVTATQVGALIDRNPGVRGLIQLREMLTLMDGGAESPQETRTRLVLIRGGLPRPQTQIAVHPYRLDMGYDEFKAGADWPVCAHILDDGVHQPAPRPAG